MKPFGSVGLVAFLALVAWGGNLSTVSAAAAVAT